jgi:hypothetical protein
MKKTKFAAHIHNPMFSMTLINPLAKLVKLDDIDSKQINEESIQYTILYTLFNNVSNFIACYRLNSKNVLDIKCNLKIIINSNSFNYPELTFIKYLEHITNNPPNTISINNLTTFPLKYEKVNLETAYSYLINGKINSDSILYKSVSNKTNINLQLISIEKIQQYLEFYILKKNSKYFNVNKNLSDFCNLNINTSYEFINPFKNEYCIYKILKYVYNYSIPLNNNKSIILSRNKTLQLGNKYLIINLQNKYSEDIFNEIIELIRKYLNKDKSIEISQKLLVKNTIQYLRYRFDKSIFVVDKNFVFNYEYINITHYYFYDINIRKINLVEERFEYIRDIKTCKSWLNPYIRYDNNIKKFIFSNNDPYVVCVDNNNISFNCTNVKKSDVEQIKLEELYCLQMKVKCTNETNIEKKLFCNDLEYKHKTIYKNSEKYIKIALGLNELFIYTNFKFRQTFNIENYNFTQYIKEKNIIYYVCTNCNIHVTNTLLNKINEFTILNLIKNEN